MLAHHVVRLALLLARAILLAGCASFSADQGMDAVASVTGDPLQKDVIAMRNHADDVASRSRAQIVHERGFNLPGQYGAYP